MSTNSSYDSSQEANGTLKELTAVRQELEHLSDKSIISIWDKLNDINKQNAILVNHMLWLRRNLFIQIALGMIFYSIVICLIGFIASIFISSL